MTQAILDDLQAARRRAARLEARLKELSRLADNVRCLYVLEHGPAFPVDDMGMAMQQLEVELAEISMESSHAHCELLD